MGTGDRKKRERKQRRNNIIDAAEEVIFSKGLEQSTMAEIARKSELSKGTLYLYFKNKDELYMAIAKRGSEMLNSRFAKLFAGDLTGIELIRKMGESYLEFVDKNPGYYYAFKHYESLKDAEELKESEMAQFCEQNSQESMNYMIRALQVGMQDGTIESSYDPKELAVIMWASTKGITLLTHIKETGHHFKMLEQMEINSQSLFENFLTLLGNGMATSEGKKKI